jgi:hypothetical protein
LAKPLGSKKGNPRKMIRFENALELGGMLSHAESLAEMEFFYKQNNTPVLGHDTMTGVFATLKRWH